MMENGERELRLIDALERIAAAQERIAAAQEKVGGPDGLFDAMDTRLANIDYTLEQIRDKT